jgi:branched-chain amino acid transport system substrate-binding protein
LPSRPPLSARARRFLLAGALAVWAGALAACRSETAPIRIGLAGPFSEARGRSMLVAAELAVREINAAGGLGGRQLELAIHDDSANSARAIAVAEALRADPAVVAVVGHLTSGTTLAAASIYNGGRDPVVAISPSASNPDLSGIGPYTFRVCATDLAHGGALARYAYEQLGVLSVAVLYQNDDYGRGILATFAEEFHRLGGTLATQDPVAATVDVAPYLARIRREGRAGALMIAGDRASATAILRAARSAGLALPVLGGDGLTGIQAEGPLAEGVYISSNYLPDRPGDRNAAFLQAYAAASGGERPDHRGAGAYDAVYLIADAIRAAGTRRSAIRAALAAVGHGRPAYDGVAGRVVFDENGDVRDKSVLVGVVRGGRLVLAGDR